MKKTNLIITGLAVFGLSNCGPLPEEETTSQKEFEELVQDHENQKTLKELSYNWSLSEIDNEIFDCQTREYSRMSRDIVEDFCTCKVQMLARRWEYIDYKHYSFSYDKVLSDSGRLDMCSGSGVADTPQAVKTDSAFEANEETEAEALEAGEELSNEEGTIFVTAESVMLVGIVDGADTASFNKSEVFEDCRAGNFYYEEVCRFLDDQDLL